MIFKFFLFLALYFHFAFGQNVELDNMQNEVRKAISIDSLKAFQIGNQCILKAREVNKLEYESYILLHFGSYFLQQGDGIKALYYLNQSDSLAKKHNFNHAKLWVQVRKGFYELLILNNNSKADSLFKDAYNKAMETGDSLIIIESLNSQASIYNSQSNYTQELRCYFQALKIAENNKYKYKIALLKNNIGNIYSYQGKLPEALQYFKEALAIAEPENEIKLTMHLYYNISLTYNQLGEKTKAKEEFTKVYNFAEKNKLWLESSLALNSLGKLEADNKNYPKAIEYYNEALKKSEVGNSLPSICQTSYNLSVVYTSLKNFNLGLVWGKKAFEIAVNNKMFEAASQSSKILSDIYETLNDYKSALTYRDYYKMYNDSLIGAIKNKEVAELQTQYYTEKKERELIEEKNLRQSSESKNFSIIIILMSALLFLIIIGLLAYISYIKRLRTQQEKFSIQLIEKIDAERERIAKDLHDDVGQTLSFIKNKLYLNKNDSPILFDELILETGNVIEKTRKISKELYPSFLNNVTLKDAISGLIKSVEKEFKIVTSLEAENIESYLTIDIKNHLYRILQECITNTIKHAEASALKISLKHIGNELVLTYRDNGKGLIDENIEPGFGLRNISERIKILKGFVVSDKNQKGIKLEFKIPDNV